MLRGLKPPKLSRIAAAGITIALATPSATNRPKVSASKVRLRSTPARARPNTNPQNAPTAADTGALAKMPLTENDLPRTCTPLSESTYCDYGAERDPGKGRSDR